MKTSILVLIFNFSILFAQDTGIVKYLPLKTGNIWVYNYSGSSGSGKMKMTVSGSIINNGHIYYTLVLTGNACGCSWNSYSPFLTQLNHGIRLDSSTGNIYFNIPGSCSWHQNETMLDSLKMSPGFVNNSCYATFCQDTNTVNLFGNSYKTKYVGLNIPTYYKFRRYAKDIGLTNSSMGCYAATQCNYTLQGCIIDGVLFGDTLFPVGVNILSTEIPEKFELFQNYPNPFNPSTKLKFQIPLLSAIPLAGRGVDAVGGRGVVSKLSIYNALGREVQVLVNESLQSGTYEVDWDGSYYPSGVYFYELISGNFTQTRKMVLIK